MVKLSEFIQAGNTVGEKMTDTQLALRHANKSATLYCPADYSAATFNVKTYHNYYTVAWLSGLSGPGGKLPDNMKGYFDIKKNKEQTLTLAPSDTTQEFKINEGKIDGTLGSMYEAWHDMDIDITLTKVLDKDGKDVTPDPDPLVNTAWDDIQKWFKDNQWTIIGVMALGGLLLVTYMVFRAKVAPAQTVAVAPAPAPVVVVTK